MPLLLGCFVALALGSSHSEAPGTARGPSSDLTDLYMFMTSRDNVALVMNVNGLTQSQGGPNYNPLDNSHVYQLHIDNDFDAHEDITFQFVAGSRYINNGRGFEVDVQGHKVPIPLAHFGPVTANPDTRAVSGLNVEEYYRVRVLHGDDYSSPIEDGPFAFRFVAGGETTREFHKAFDNAGTKTFPPGASGYDAYNAYVKNAAIYKDVRFPGCPYPASMFVGPRRESFSVALGETFDLVNINNGPIDLGNTATERKNSNSPSFDGNSLDRMNVISFVLEVHPSCLQNKNGGKVLGAWASVRKLEHRDDSSDRKRSETSSGETKHYAGEQTTRLGNPLVNELVIGTTYKNEWNSRHPSGDERYNNFLLYPALPQLLEILFGGAGVVAPKWARHELLDNIHRGTTDPNINTCACGTGFENVYADMLRINIETAKFKPCSAQQPLTLLQGDAGGFPNGRRLGDDVVDFVLRVAMGVTCGVNPAGCGLTSADIPASAFFPYSDKSPIRACMFKCDEFPFLNPPIPGDKLFELTDAYKNSQFSVNQCT